MTQITDSNYEKIIKGYLSKGHVVVAMSGSKGCKNCIKTQQNITNYLKANESSKLAFVYMDNSFDFALEESYHVEPLNEYPKTTVYYSWMERKFIEGVISTQQLEEL